MFELSTRARLGLYVLVELARSAGEARTSDQIADLFGASPHHLAKVMQALARAGWISGSRGPSGGYAFSGDAREISMADVIELFEGTSRPGEEPVPRRNPTERAVEEVFREIDEHTYYTLESITVHLLAHPRPTSEPPRSKNSSTPAGQHGRHAR